MTVHVVLNPTGTWREKAMHRVRGLFSLVRTGRSLGILDPHKINVYRGGPSEALGGELVDSIPPETTSYTVKRIIEHFRGLDLDEHIVEVECTFLPGEIAFPATATAFNHYDWRYIYRDVHFDTYKTHNKTFVDLYFDDDYQHKIHQWLNRFVEDFRSVQEIDIREDVEETAKLVDAHFIFRRKKSDFDVNLIELMRKLPKESKLRKRLKTQPAQEFGDQMNPYTRGFLVQTLQETNYPEEILRYAEKDEELGYNVANSLVLFSREKGSFLRFLQRILPPLVDVFSKFPQQSNITEKMKKAADVITLR